MATTYDNASLVMIPSGVKEDKLYSIKPTDGSGDFTFSRGTDTATRVNASGLIEKERGNLAIQSNSFSTSWSATNATLTSGQSGYDGSSDAWSLSGTGANARVDINNTSSGLLTWSVYAKAGSSDFLRLRVDYGAAYVDKYFDLSNGSLGGSFFAPIISNIEAVGATGWYRCSVTLSQSISTIRIYTADVDLGGSSTGNIYIQDAMLNQGLVAQPYIETTTAAVYEGITDNLPRLDYSGGASCPSLLLEPSRTNLFIQSEYLNTSYSLNAGTTLTDNYGISPEGVQNATRYVGTGGSGFGRQYTLTNGTDYTISVYVKSNTGATQYCRLIGDSSNISSDLEVTTEWTRVYYTWTSAGLANKTNGLFRDSSDNDIDILVYGMQLEAGSYPTSYIPCMGTSASRAGDSCSKTGISSLIGQTEGTLFIEMKDLVWRSSATRIIGISDGTQQNRVILLTGQTSNTLRAIVTTGNVLQTSTTASAPFGNVKLAIAYSSAGGVVYSNGSQVLSFGAISVPACSALYIQMVEDGTLFPADGKNTQALVFKTRLTDAELAALTA